MSGNTQKEEIYRTAMRICRMWGVAETLDSGIPPYETPIATQPAENQKDGSAMGRGICTAT